MYPYRPPKICNYKTSEGLVSLPTVFRSLKLVRNKDKNVPIPSIEICDDKMSVSSP